MIKKPSVEHLLPPDVTGFPFEVFPEEMRESFYKLGHHHNIPIDFMGCAALFTVGALAGNMYRADLNGGVKPILYMLLIGPSSVGKSPAFTKLCMDIISPLRAKEHAAYKERMKEWQNNAIIAKAAKRPFTDPEPVKCIRMIEDATMEAITKFAEISPAGFGIFYDEGDRLFNGVNQYKKDTSSISFWNEMWYGKSKEIVRVDSARDRYIDNAGVSIMMGMQKDRLIKHLDSDTLASGIAYRFLMVESDYIELNEDVDLFAPSVYPCVEWTSLVESLFNRGMYYTSADSLISVGFTKEAKVELNRVTQDNIRTSNVMIRQKDKHDDNAYLMAYNGKISAYVARMALVLSIIDNYQFPEITKDHILGAEKLYHFFKGNGSRILTRIKTESASGLTEKEQALIDLLPADFTAEVAAAICKSINLNPKFFLHAFRRKYRPMGLIVSKNRGNYSKT